MCTDYIKDTCINIVRVSHLIFFVTTFLLLFTECKKKYKYNQKYT